jgi:hypothetical protein
LIIYQSGCFLRIVMFKWNYDWSPVGMTVRSIEKIWYSA